MKSIIKVNELSKRFGSQTAVNRLSFEVHPGQVFGILGPNGSGKTTTLSMVLSLLKAQEGTIELFGSTDLLAGRKRMGVTLETAGFMPSFSGRKNLLMAALNKDVDPQQVDELLKKVDLYEARNKRFKAYSYGMKQRLAIASALLGNPEVLILDEPTNGLDPHGIIEVRNLIKSLAAEGKTVVIASHLLSEMEKLCTHFIILAKGQLIASGELANVLQDHASLEDAFIHLTAASK